MEKRRNKGMTYVTTKKAFKTKKSKNANMKKFIDAYRQAHGMLPSQEELPRYDLQQRAYRRESRTGPQEISPNTASSSRLNEENNAETQERVEDTVFNDGSENGSDEEEIVDYDIQDEHRQLPHGNINSDNDNRTNIVDDNDDFGNNDEYLFAADNYLNSEKGEKEIDDDDEDDVDNNDDDNDEDDEDDEDGEDDGDDEDDEDDDDDDDGDDDDDDDNDNENNEDENATIFNIDPGEIVTLRPNMTVGVIVTTVIAAALRFKFCFEALLAILGIFKFLLNQSNIPVTKNALWQCLGRKEEFFQTRNIYCRNCLHVIGQNKIPVIACFCGSSGPDKPLKSTAYFINLNITQQLKRMFSIPNFIKLLRYRYDRKKTNIGHLEDIFDGRLYKKLQQPGQFLSAEFNYSLTINTDGCQVGKSTTDSAWPVLLTINELPPHARKRYIILAGIFIDKHHPNLNSCLKPIIEELEFLHHTGITWKPDGNKKVRSKFVTITCIVDSVARYEILSMKRFGGTHGCTFCYAKGEKLGTLGRVYPMKDFRERTDAEMRAHMNEATRTGIPLWGIKGSTILRSLSLFDLRKSMVVDGMHNAFLGIPKTIMELILSSPATCAWYFGGPRIRTIINQRLLKIRTPSKIARKSRSLDSYRSWKATEWRNWILYYAVPCLTGLVPNEYLLLFCKLSEALHIFNRDSLSEENLNRADKLIIEFLNHYQTLFTRSNMTYNLHILRHMTRTVEDWGPMWVHSAFIYEAFNKKIIESLHGPTGRELQIMNKYLLNDFARCIIHDPNISEETKRKVIAIFNTGKKPPFRNNEVGQEIANFQGIGMSVTKNPNDWQRDLLTNKEQTFNKIVFYEKAIIRGTVYCNRHGERSDAKSCNKYVYTNTNNFAEILSIISFLNDEGQTINGAFIRYCEDNGSLGEAKHIRALRSLNRKEFVLEDEMMVPVIIINLDNIDYGVRLTNVWETD